MACLFGCVLAFLPLGVIGSTTGSGPVGLGSSPGGAAEAMRVVLVWARCLGIGGFVTSPTFWPGLLLAHFCLFCLFPSLPDTGV